MSAQPNDVLVRKQYLISKSQASKLEKMAKENGTSVAKVVRLAIDAYDPHGAETMESDDLMELVSVKLKESIKATQKANRTVSKALKSLECRGA